MAKAPRTTLPDAPAFPAVHPFPGLTVIAQRGDQGLFAAVQASDRPHRTEFALLPGRQSLLPARQPVEITTPKRGRTRRR